MVMETDHDGRRPAHSSVPHGTSSRTGAPVFDSAIGGHVVKHDHRLQLTWPRPSGAVQPMIDRLAVEEWDHIGARTGTAVAGFTVPTVVTALIWRTFGRTAEGARTTLDWAGLLDRQADPINDLARRYATTATTLRRRVQRARTRGANLPLTPRVLQDATRATQPTDDALGRQRCAHILGIPVPADSTAPGRLR